MCFVAVIEKGRACSDKCPGIRVEYFVDLCEHGVLADNGEVFRCQYRNRILDSAPSPVMCDGCEQMWLAEWDAWVDAQMRNIAHSMLFFDMDGAARDRAVEEVGRCIRRANGQIRRNYERERARLVGVLRDELEFAKVMFYTTGESVRLRNHLPLDGRRGMTPASVGPAAGLPRWQLDYGHYQYLYRLIPDMAQHFVLDKMQRESGKPLGLRRGRVNDG
ncbi:hypothetical protein MFIFM68171_08877 [Madurella fahalii]|uniref:Uncharacterized protein n=1 Tax=Madurella fahalii TaxID=1157608 RepID=A0ABQ0GLM1_9PEZI